MTATATNLDRDDILRRLNETHVRAIYEALGVETFKPNGSDNWMTFCPWRENHRTPALSIKKIDGLWNDKATGEDGSIFDAVMRARSCDFIEALAFVASVIGSPTAPSGPSSNGRRIVATYDYHNEHGQLLHRTIRYEPKGFSQCRPNGSGGWVWSLKGIEPVLYHLPELLTADPGHWVLLVEGEKDADRLRALGFVATTNAMGSGKWRESYTETLRDRRIVLLPDNDAAGNEHVRTVAPALVGTMAALKVLNLPELPPKGDVSDWLDAGGTADELRRLIREAPDWEPSTYDTESLDEPAWPPRQPLPPVAPVVPTFPAAMVPEPFRPWLTDLAEHAALPLEMFAAPAIVAAGAVVGRHIAIRPTRFDDWTCIPNLWGGIVAGSGTMKSYALKESQKGIGQLAATTRERFALQRDAAEAKRKRIEAEIKAIENQMTAAAKKGAGLSDLEAKLAGKQQELREAAEPERRYLTQDATTEKLGELLRDNPRGLLLARDELAGWLRTLDKLGREGDREFYLEAWNGDVDYTYDRIGRGSFHIPALTLSIVGGIQPGKLRRYVTDATTDGDGADGLLPRLQLLVWPDQLGDWHQPTRWPNKAAKATAYEIYRRLDEIKPQEIGATVEAGSIPYLTFEPTAQQVFDDWRDELEHRLRTAEMQATPAFASHLSKYRSLMPSLALLFHLVNWVSMPEHRPTPVTEHAARLAAAWCEYLEQHARKLYHLEIAPGQDAAHRLAEHITAGHILDGQSVRDLYRVHWSGLTTPEAVYAGLDVLAEIGWLRIESQATAGRRAQRIRLHPDLIGASNG